MHAPDLMPDLPAAPVRAMVPASGGFPVKWFIVGLVVFVAAILLESWRQRRKLKRRGTKRSGRPNLLGTGILELQGHLQPDRKVEFLQQEAKDKERAKPAYRLGVVGDTQKDAD